MNKRPYMIDSNVASLYGYLKQFNGVTCDSKLDAIQQSNHPLNRNVVFRVESECGMNWIYYMKGCKVNPKEIFEL